MHPVRIEHGSAARRDILYVDWLLGNTCNYACSYCPDGLHDGSAPWHDLKVVDAFAERLATAASALNKRVHIQFTGGEVSVRPRFLEMLRSLRRFGFGLGVISNGSRTLRWWREALPLLDAVTLTYHPEFANLDRFVAVVALASGQAETHVNVTAPPDRFDQAILAAETVARSCERVSILLKPMFVDFGPDLYPYSDAQLEALRTRRFVTAIAKPGSVIRGEMRVIYDDGEERVVSPQTLIVTGANRWRGWECDVGLELISVDVRGDVYRGVCREGGALGNIADLESLKLPTAPIRCGRASCTCLLDVMTSRRLPTEAMATPARPG